MFKKLIIYSLFPILTLSVFGDQLYDKQFRLIFPLVSEKTIWKLIYGVNEQNTTKGAIEFSNRWIDYNWIEPNDSEKEKYKRVAEKEFCRERTIEFLKHREAVKKFIRYLYRSTQIVGYLNSTEAELMRSRFWRTDRSCSNEFTCVKDAFFEPKIGIYVELGESHPNVTEDLEAMVEPLYKMEGIADELNYVFRNE